MLHGLIQHTVSSWPDHKKMTRVKLKECRVVTKAYEYKQIFFSFCRSGNVKCIFVGGDLEEGYEQQSDQYV